MKIEEILMKHFEWTEDEINKKQNSLKTLKYIKDENVVFEKFELYKKNFDITMSEFIKMLKLSPAILTYTEENIQGKLDLLQNEFGIEKSEFIKLIKQQPAIFCVSAEILKEKIKLYQTEFGMKESELTKLLKRQPVLFCLAEDNIKRKAEFYQTEFDLEKSEFIKMIKSMPTLLGITEKNIKDKIEFYQTEFNLTRLEFNKLIKTLPVILSYSETSIKSKVQLYMKEFGLTKPEFIKILKGLPGILCYSEESVKEKHKQTFDLSIPKEFIINNISILTAPKNTLKIRYFILRQIASKEDILRKTNWSMTNQNKTYARLMYLQNKMQRKIKLSEILSAEKIFSNIHKVSSKELMQKYPLPKEFIYEVQEKFFEEEGITFSAEEKEFIEKEYGE